MRSISDDLCREYDLQVYEKVFRGHRSYGEYTAKHSWKKQLAEDVARCIKAGGNSADFKLLLEECGIGKKSILFSLEKGYGGLQADRKCSNSKLMSYGDFSTENILQSIDFNSFVLDEAWHDFPLVSEVLGLLGAIDHPDDPDIYERTFLAQLNPEDFKGKTKLQFSTVKFGKKMIALDRRICNMYNEANFM